MGNSDLGAALFSAHRFGRVLTSRWPIIAAHAVAAGCEGPAMLALACLPATASRWEVEPLLPGLFDELPGLPLTDDEAAWIVARLIAESTGEDEAVLAALAELASPTRYCQEPFVSAYLLIEELASAVPPGTLPATYSSDLLAKLRALGPLDVDRVFVPLLCTRGA